MSLKSVVLLFLVCCLTTLCVLMVSYPTIVRHSNVGFSYNRVSGLWNGNTVDFPDAKFVHNLQDENGVMLMQNNGTKWTDLIKCQAIRLKHLKTQCGEFGPHQDITMLPLSDLQRFTFKFLVDDFHQVIFKSVPKTGCSSWKTLLIMNSPRYNASVKDFDIHNWPSLDKNYNLKNMRDFSRSGIIQRLASYFFILTVRHPFSRIESAFLDKLVYNGKHRYIRNKDPVRFDEVLIYDYFQEFLEKNVIVQREGKNINGHWKPIVKHAHPCIFPFSFLAKTETIDAEMEYISQVKLSGVGGALHENKSRNKTLEHQRQDGGKVLPLFSRLKNPAETIQRLQSIYGRDMELFGYSVKLENDKVIAVCDKFEEYGMCC